MHRKYKVTITQNKPLELKYQVWLYLTTPSHETEQAYSQRKKK